MSGKLGSANLSAGVMTLLYTAPVGKVPTVSARVANRNPFAIRSTIAIGAGASPVEADYVAFNVEIEPYGIFESSGMPMSAGEKVWVSADNDNVSVRVSGFEE